MRWIYAAGLFVTAFALGVNVALLVEPSDTFKPAWFKVYLGVFAFILNLVVYTSEVRKQERLG